MAVTTAPSTGQQPSSGDIQGVMLTNIGSVVTHVAIGASDVSVTIPTTTAAANGFPLMPNTAQTFSVRPDFYISAVTSAGTATLSVTPGYGI